MASKNPSHLHPPVKQEQNPNNSGASFQTFRRPKTIRRLWAIPRIRRMLSQGQTHKNVMQELGLPPRTYYRYVGLAYEVDKFLLLKQNKDTLIIEISTFRDRLLESYRRLTALATSEDVLPHDRLLADCQAAEIALAIARLAIQGPMVIRGFQSDNMQELGLRLAPLILEDPD